MKRTKQWLAVLLSVVLIISQLPVVALAATSTFTGSDGITYEFDEATGTITGGQLNGSTEMVIPSEINGISVSAIGDNAFHGAGITSLTIPASVKEVGAEAFARCLDLTSVTFLTDTEGGGTKTIGPDAFKESPQLQSVTLPGTLKTMGERAFLSCSALTELQLPSGLQTIGGYALSETALTDIAIPGTVTSLGEGAFCDTTALTSVVFGEGCSISEIGGNTFARTSITSISLPESVQTIGSLAFHQTDLTSIVLPAGIQSVGAQAFQDCAQLQSADVRGASIGDGAFQSCAKLETVIMTESMGGSSIGSQAFYNCTALTSVTIPDSVTSLGTEAFYMCYSMTDAVIGSGVTVIPQKAFYNCTGLQHVTFRGNVTAIGDWAFYMNTSLGAITFPDTLQTIGTGAFDHSSALGNVSIPAGTVSIGDGAFSTCALHSAYLWNRDVVIGSGAFEWEAEDFKLYGYPDSTAEDYRNPTQTEVIPFADITQTLGRTLTVSVQDAEGNLVTEGVTVHWYDAQGNDLGVTGGTFEAQPGTDYRYQVVLSGTALENYLQPEMGTIAASDEAVATVTLAARKKIAISLQVQDGETQSPLLGAAVTVTNYTTGAVYSGTAGEDGACTISNVAVGQLAVRISLNGYYSQLMQSDLTDLEGETHDFGTVGLTRTISDRITLQIFLSDAAVSGTAASVHAANRLEDYQFCLSGTNGEITGFEAQSDAIVFHPGAVTAGETITVTVSDPKGRYADASVAVTLDSERIGRGEVTLSQKGGFRLGVVSVASAAKMAVFGENGALVYAGDAVSGGGVESLDAGTYQVAVFEKTEQLVSVPSLAYLTQLGLQAGQDYLLQEITVQNGLLLDLGDLEVPGLNGLVSYVVAANSGVTTGKATLSPGETFLVRVSYELDAQKQQNANAVEIVLPAGIQVQGTTVSVNGQPKTFSLSSDGTITVSVTDSSAVITVYAQAGTTPGEFVVGARLQLASGNVQALGSAKATIESAKLTAPQRTSKSSIEVSGKTLAGSTVTIYDNDVKIGETQANQAGTWKTTVALAGELYSYSCHWLRAEIQNEMESFSVSTESTLVVYDQRSVEVETIYMYNSIHGVEQETVYDFSGNGQTSTYYNYDGAYPTFTFKVLMAEESDGLYDNLCVYTIDDSGEITYIPLEENGGAWYGTYDYVRSSQIPAQVGVAYDSTAALSIPEDAEYIADTAENLTEVSTALAEQYAGVASEFFQSVENPSTGRTDVMAGPEGEQVYLFSYKTVTDQSVDLGSLAQQGFSELSDGLWIRFGSQDDHPIEWIADTQNQTVYRTDYYAAQEGLQAAAFAQTRIGVSDGTIYTTADGMKYMEEFFVDGILQVIQAEEFWPTDQWLGEFIGKSWAAFQAWKTISETYNDLIKPFEAQILGNAEMLRFQLAEFKNILGRFECSDGDTVAQAINMVIAKSSELENMINHYVEDVGEKIVGPAYFDMLAIPLSVSGFACLPAGAAGIMLKDLSLIQYQRVLAYQTERYNDVSDAIYQAQLDLIALLKQCKPEEPEEKTDPAAVPGNLDPSGFVYEAVPSNRLEGVTATIYQEGGGSAWDAAAFDQENPQITGADGWYQWLVPTGKWKVIFSKLGYESTDTSHVAAANSDGWLVVPPPQMNVHVGMVSLSAPSVLTAVAYEQQAEIQFSQYMDIDSVKSAISMTVNGKATEITVVPMDPEDNLEGTKQYATRFAVTTDAPLTGTVQIAVGGGAQNYAGTPLETEFVSAELTPTVKPTGISCTDQLQVRIDTNGTLTVSLQPGIENQTLTVENLTPSLVQVLSSGSVTIGASGSASISLKGLMPGTGRLRITEPVSGLSKVVDIKIVMSGETEGENGVATVTAYLENGIVLKNGDTVPAGSKVFLGCATDGAEIRYTLNDTCPCLDTASTYSSPITISSETLIRAVAVKDGVYGDTIRLKLYVRAVPETPDASGSGSTVSGTLTFETNGGSAIAPIVAGRYTRIDLTEYIPQRDGYTFTGWYSDAACTQKITSIVMSRSMTVYAGWEKTAAANPFHDVASGDWYYDNVMYVYENGYMRGTTATTFSPNSTLSRQQVWMVLARIAGYDPADMTEARAWAMANGISDGTNPGSAVTRQQLVTLLYRFAQQNGYDTTDRADLSTYSDVSSVASYAVEPMAWSVADGIIGGTTQWTLDPTGTATRGQFAAILNRYMT